MATVSLPELAVSTFTKGFETFDHILTKAEEYAKEKGIDANATFVQARLIEDQLPFAFQIQNASKAVQVNLGRLSGVEPTLFENDEKTLDDLHKRVKKTLDLLKSFDVSTAAGRDNELVEYPFGGQTRKLTVKAAIVTQGLPNFYFHLTTGYSILRSRGVPLGKADFLTNFLEFSA
ncbi:hypothetical protein JX266_007566 [Neoarthrinium moseri]|uniref:uncharacterized protein n=1 Tax=Neoarthrinium moseri TaxID=1658444 RepID=UPI001FDC22CF|nr:uncharacterized protein JN550_008940 [Neoarthrinium moseri]KAI1846361.1 hypothetical protein JX266_007566 [Neoarthrinium moseri]KAI1864383.1 hypothetical protein JN550_008940 [Neoarthrinium moseri]